MTTLEDIIKELRTLTPSKLEEAATYLHALKTEDHARRVAVLEASAGMLTEEEADEMERIIAEGCGKVDARDW